MSPERTRYNRYVVPRNTLLVDVLMAVVLVAIVLIVEPGIAVAAILALILLIVWGISFVFGRRPGAAARVSPRRVRPPRPGRR